MLDATKVKFTGTYQPTYANKVDHQPVRFMANTGVDTTSFSKPSNVVAFKQRGKELCVVSFTGLQNPLPTTTEGPLGIQMKVRGVTAHQRSTDPMNMGRKKDENINDLAESKWKDGQKLEFRVSKDMRGQEKITISDPEHGELGFVHPEIAEILLPILKANPQVLTCELSNVIAGTTKGAETIGLRVNVLCRTNNPSVEAKVRNAFSQVLNNPECADKVLLYQPNTTPEEVLSKILSYEDSLYKNNPAKAEQSKKEIQQVIDKIATEIKNPANKRILLLGHCKPDGDTLGCVLGLKNAISLMDPNRQIDCAVDDKVPGLFRHKLPGIDGEIKRPYNPERIQRIQKDIARLKTEPQTKPITDQIEMLSRELEIIQNPENLLARDAKYDLVISMDVPTPKRFTDKFKKYFQEAGKIIYIDHHPHRLNEWKDAAPSTGFDMEKVHQNGLAWISDAVPAATQLVAILANKLIPDFKTIASGEKTADQVFTQPGQLDKLKAFVASVVTGASTDTGSFTRTANLLPQHIKKPDGTPVLVQDRPNFLPEGLSKWLMNLTNGAIDKKWLREEISFDITDEKSTEIGTSARELMLESSIRGKVVDPELSLGIIQVNYDDMNKIWQTACDTPGSEDTTLLDVQNAFKYSEAMGVLRADPTLTGKSKGGPQGGRGSQGNRGGRPAEPQSLSEKAKEDYQGKYDKDRIAILVCQDKKKDALDEKLEYAEDNGLRLSFRSMEGSIHAELIASLFGGGGHGGAAGGRVDLPGVEIDTPLAVKVGGKVETDAAKILKTLKENYKYSHDTEITPDEQRAKIVPMELVIADKETGKTTADLIRALVTEIRKEQPVQNTEKAPQQNHGGKKGKKGRRNHLAFAGFLTDFLKKAS